LSFARSAAEARYLTTSAAPRRLQAQALDPPANGTAAHGGTHARAFDAPAFDARYDMWVPATHPERNIARDACAADGVFRPRAAHALKLR